MGELIQFLDGENEVKVKRFSSYMAVVIAVISLLSFAAGVIFLRDSVFKNYFNPSRHAIVEQDPETMEIFAWKDASGNVYTPGDPDVKHFPYGTMFLLLALLVLATQSHSLIVKNYAATLVIRNHLQLSAPAPEEAFAPGLPALAVGAEMPGGRKQSQVSWKFKVANQR
ncbi:MAG: hypothetical protein AB1556_17275 [Bacillota bacterium]